MVAHEEGGVYRLLIEGYGAGGEGVARLDGRAVFVSGAVRGETCAVRLTKVGKSAAWGEVERVLISSPARVAPDCPCYPRCGGCQLRHITYEEELCAKRQRAEDALRRIGGSAVSVEEILGASDTMRYRNKIQFPVSPAGIGFYRARSHEVIDAEDCLLQPEAATRLRRAVKDWAARCGAAPYDERAHTGLLRHVLVRVSGAGQSLCCILANGAVLPQEGELVSALRAAEPGLQGVVLGVNTRRTNVILGERYRTLWGQDTLDDTLCGLTFRLSVPSFFQVNRAQAEALYEKATQYTGLTGRETVLDLYCGVGAITLFMARRAQHAIGAEVVPQAVEDARENAARNGIRNAEFLCADAGEAAAALLARGLRPDVVCVDPPRKGLSPAVIDAVCAMAPDRFVYVSCDPGTLGRDVRILEERGFRAERAASVDLFPRTAHVETVVLLSKLKCE